MIASSSEMAAEAAYQLPDETSRMIVALGQDRLRALQQSGAAIDARCTQVAAFQLAAAAFAGGFVGSQHARAIPGFLGAMGCLLFVIGAAIAFNGVRSCKQQVAGLEPSWWHRATQLENFRDDMARSWLAEVTESMIEFTREVDERRASALNHSLMHGLGGAVAMCIAAFSLLWP